MKKPFQSNPVHSTTSRVFVFLIQVIDSNETALVQSDQFHAV